MCLWDSVQVTYTNVDRVRITQTIYKTELLDYDHTINKNYIQPNRWWDTFYEIRFLDLSDPLINLFTSYLNNRNQFVAYNQKI